MKPGRMKSLDAYMKALPGCAMTKVVSGMFHPVALRDMGYWVVPDFLRYRDAMTPAQREQATATLLFTAYVSAEDEYSPMRTMLGGHPNFMADLKFPLAAASFLFPEHPMAGEWSAQDREVHGTLRRFLRPPLGVAMGSQGGSVYRKHRDLQLGFHGANQRSEPSKFAERWEKFLRDAATR